MIEIIIGMMTEKAAIILHLAQPTQNQDLLVKNSNVSVIQIITGTKEKEFVIMFHLVAPMQQ